MVFCNSPTVYLRSNMALAKTAMPGAAHGDVMRALSRRWNEANAEVKSGQGVGIGVGVDHAAYWKGMAEA